MNKKTVISQKMEHASNIALRHVAEYSAMNSGF